MAPVSPFFRPTFRWRFAAWLWIALLFGFASCESRADVITDIGMGVKIANTTSNVLLPECHTVIVTEYKPERPDLNDGKPRSCGGDNPVFIGWPIAYEWTGARGIMSVRAGWFHFSHWADGKSNRETHMDAATVSVKINWSARRRNRK